MTDYKEMYLTMMRASERAMEILIEAQKKCEEMYMNTDEFDGEHYFHNSDDSKNAGTKTNKYYQQLASGR